MLAALGHNVNTYYSSGAVLADSRNETIPSALEPESDPQKTSQKTERRVQTLPGQDKTNPDGSPRDAVELSQEAQEIRELQVRDHEVRAHEAAHAAAGGAYTGAPTYTFERGPDGQSYAVGGAVSIDISPIKGDPQATLQKAQQVRAAALAPAEPSAQDMRVAQKAQAMASAARMDLSRELAEDLESLSHDSGSKIDSSVDGDELISADIAATVPSINQSSGSARLSIYS
ncbi:MAG: hypothetical protein KAG12_04215 [Desulfuromusa sp.]|nr:hypothetical protein [Desulfuromusa sp.]